MSQAIRRGSFDFHRRIQHAGMGAALVLLLSLGSVRFMVAQQFSSSGKQQKKIDDVIYNLEHQLANAEKQQDKAFFERALADDLIYVAYNGLVFRKPKLISAMNYMDVAHYSAENFKFRSLGPNSELVTYDLRLRGTIAGQRLPPKQYVSSIWVQQQDGWRLLFHQSTPADHD